MHWDTFKPDNNYSTVGGDVGPARYELVLLPSCLTIMVVKLCKGNKNVLSTQCKDYYKEFVNIKCERPTALYRWEEMYYCADFDWPVLFKIPHKVARETDVQSLQFKIINRYIPCKENLYLWGKESSDNVAFAMK